ncbi:MAG: T9SS type A sorting domain-containing protein [Saprospiraceae bacterium]
MYEKHLRHFTSILWLFGMSSDLFSNTSPISISKSSIGSPNDILYYHDWQEGTKTSLVSYFDRKDLRYPNPQNANNVLVNSKIQWTSTVYNFLTNSFVTSLYKFSSDSIALDGHFYRTLLSSQNELGTEFQPTNRKIRELNNKVFEYFGGKDYLVYDFSLMAGDTVRIEDPYFATTSTYVVTKVDSNTLLQGDKRKVLQLHCLDAPDFDMQWIEGIGSVFGPFLGSYPCGLQDLNIWVNCVYINVEIAFQNAERPSCWETSSSLDYNAATIDIYPNPASDVLYIDISSGQNTNNALKAHIQSIDGKTIKEVKLLNANNTVDISSLISGVYTIKVSNQDDVAFVSKFVKLK